MYVKASAQMTAPLGVMTETVTAPGVAAGGVMTVSRESVTETMVAAGWSPNCTSSASVAVLRPEPAISTWVAPLDGPWVGEIEVIIGVDMGRCPHLSC